MSERVRRYIANADYSRDEHESFAARVFGSAVETLRVAAGRRPFALVVDSFQPHEPWTPPRRYVDLYGDPDYAGPEPAIPHYGRAEDWLDDDERPFVLDRMRALYAAEVTMTDRWLGLLLEPFTRVDHHGRFAECCGVHEWPAVNRGHVDRDRLSPFERRQRVVGGVDAEVAGEVIERPSRQHQ